MILYRSQGRRKRSIIIIGLIAIVLALGTLLLARWAIPDGVHASVQSAREASPRSIPSSGAAIAHEAVPGRLPAVRVAATPASQQSFEKQAFESVNDLWAFASGALHSSDAAYVFEAYTAARECAGLRSMLSDLQNFASGVTAGPIKGALTPERQFAIERLRTKCKGFTENGATRSTELANSLLRQGTSLGGPEFSSAQAAANEKGDNNRLGALLFSRSPAARDAALPLLMKELDSHRAIDGNVYKPADSVSGVAAMLALCDLGKDCTVQSYSSSLRCAVSARCGETLWYDWKEGLTEEQTRAVETLRARIVDAVNRKDLSNL